MDPAANELQKICESGFQFSLSTLWTRGFTIKLGNYGNQLEAEVVVTSCDEAIEWLQRQIKARHPDSMYARQLKVLH